MLNRTYYRKDKQFGNNILEIGPKLYGSEEDSKTAVRED